ncbi:MAG: hypothetical protein FJX80_06180 [Bacteroidetes bacterium]|nr:hypothetical protein [Bacteroidota bacterium]
MSKRFKRVIYLSVGLISLAVLSYPTLLLLNPTDNETFDPLSFAIDDTNSISKIIITDAFSKTFELNRSGDSWVDKNGQCVFKEGVHNILEASAKIQFKAYLNEKAEKVFYKLMQTNHIKVDFYQNGNFSKRWYIGPSAQDHNGQIMILEGPNKEKSNQPLIMSLRGISGIIEPRFFADPRKWLCTGIFNLESEKISKVDVSFSQENYRNFSIENFGSNFSVKSNGIALSAIDTSNVIRYLQKYKRVNFESANYELNKLQCDSLLKAVPFCTLSLTERGTTSPVVLKMHRIRVNEPQENEFGELVNMDMNKFWCVLPTKEIVKCQYFVFNHLILGDVYFPALSSQFPKQDTKKLVPSTKKTK